jgi:hypothetical protein
MKRNWILLALLVLLGAAAFYAWAPRFSIGGTREPLQLQDQRGNQLFLALQSARLDFGKTHAGVPAPAESGVSSTAAYLALLRKYDYLNDRDLSLFRDFVIANVSENDPPQTVLLISRNAYAALQAGKPLQNFTIFQKDGEGGSFKQGNLDRFPLPPRQPAFLKPSD